MPTLIHPSAIVSKYSQLAKGVVIHANSVIQANAIIRQNTVVSHNVSVSHDSEIGISCYLAANSVVGAFIEIKDFVFVGQSAVIVSGKLDYIGHDSIVGAGSVVIQNIEPYSVVAGNPAKLIKKIF